MLGQEHTVVGRSVLSGLYAWFGKNPHLSSPGPADVRLPSDDHSMVSDLLWVGEGLAVAEWAGDAAADARIKLPLWAPFRKS